MELNIKRVVVLKRKGCTDDIAVFIKDCPNLFNFEFAAKSLCMKFEAPKNQGVKYVKEHFGVEPEVIDSVI